MHHVTILGASGSIGASTLDVIARHPDRFTIHALSGHRRMDILAQRAAASRARVVAVPDAAAADAFRQSWPGGVLPEIRVGVQALADVAADPASDTIVAAIVGAAGLPSVMAAARAGKRILLANKEALVAAGNLFMQAVREHGATLLPIDSEHNAIFQCLPAQHADCSATVPAPGVKRLVLTASGGPFRRFWPEQLEGVTPEQACAHPNWSMGRKISVDSATMVNKGLEVIEAHWLFSMPADRLEVLIHPQSLIHSLVEYDDGSVLAELGNPDMRTPIAQALAYPDRIASGVGLLDLAAAGRLDFEQPDPLRFPCLSLCMQALRAGQAACIALNAANEIAVEAFLAGNLRYTWIARVLEAVLEWQAGLSQVQLGSLEDILEFDKRARHYAGNLGLA
ncbi:1-deoxy-D-xylulose-5-phosphate reductoisomerase [Alcaligenaceae bacterium SJ-26]|nr:1-deoxy-D-xylulose-5-phosphate reductoisomerase [Alcaligenaceae bacterium SJ-26]